MSTATITLTIIHTLISVAGILVGVPAIMDIFRSRVNSTSIWLFLITAILTSVSSFTLPLHAADAGHDTMPAIIVAIVALVILAAVLFARTKVLEGALWRWIYAGGMVISLYLLFFVAIAQTFGKVGVLQPSAPTAFPITQGITLLIFVLLGLAAVIKFRPSTAQAYA
ncbi:hypothetical protein ACMDCR_28510 [Labrys okinawensis]|uniref:hypothetical protein n=1 Tax=Labrys okinawensis TaxID=346911 RepID=UPI0039BD92F7